MMSKTCHIVGAGDFSPHLLKLHKDDLVIAADAGYAHLNNAGIPADLYIGDGDSLGKSPEGIDTVVLPVVKDDTDMLAALRVGLSRGYRRFLLYGALGGKRFSHSLANLQALSFLSSQGAEGQLLDENASISLLAEGKYEFSFAGGYFSLFSFEGEAKVSITGAKYPLSEALLSPLFPLGVSNEGTEHTHICVHQGNVILVREP